MTVAPDPHLDPDPKRRQRRDAILDVAARVFAERGYRQTDVQVVADVAGVGKGTVYRCFPTKEALFLAAVDRGMQQLQAAVNEAADREPRGLDRLAAAIRAYLGFFDSSSTLVELLMQERAEFRERHQPTYFVYRNASLSRWERLVADLIESGAVRDVPVSRVLDVISNTLYGAIFTTAFAGRRIPYEQQADDIVDIVFHGIVAAHGGDRGPSATEPEPA